MQHGSSIFHDGLVLSFTHTILLGIITYNGIILDSILILKVNEFIRSVFFTIIKPEELDYFPCLLVY